MIDGGANNGQAQRDIDRMAKAGVLQNRQALVVVHRKDCVLVAGRRRKRRICRQRSANAHSRAGQFANDRGDDGLVLSAEMAAFAGMRVEAADDDLRVVDTET